MGEKGRELGGKGEGTGGKGGGNWEWGTPCPPPPFEQSLKLVDYLHVQADNPWYNYYIYPLNIFV